MTESRYAVRDELVQALLHRLEKDLSDLRDLSGIRIRFVPRHSLIETISEERVERLLNTFPAQGTPGRISTRDVAHYISPPEGECCCSKAECTGARMILATLLFIGKEALIQTICTSKGLQVCDRDLPFGTRPAQRRRISHDGHIEDARDPACSPTHAQTDEASLFHLLSPPEKELFSYFQWQVISPYLTQLALDEAGGEMPDEVSLPWKEIVRVEEPMDGKFSFVHKIRMFPGNHNFVSRLRGSSPVARCELCGSCPHKTEDRNDVFALKTFDETIVSGLTDERFTAELEANRNAANHSRIVPVLSAFKHRGRCHLVLPWADGGSLADIWDNYSPLHIDPENGYRPATWCSEPWLMRECMGVAEALAATHGFGDNTPPGRGRQLHADIKPENLLCFFSDNSKSRCLTLKLADLGEAVQVVDGIQINAEKLPHTKSYRPPEQRLGPIGLNYDTWCLGCVYLEFITWFLKGSQGVEAFRDAREIEEHDSVPEADGPEIIEDIFFKRVRRNHFPSIRTGRRTRTSITFGQQTTRSSLWISSSVRIEHKVRDSVLVVSLLSTHRNVHSDNQC